MFYFDWLQKGNPTGTVDRFPELKDGYETSVPGIYCIGDLRGVPLIKLAAESGHELIRQLQEEESFARQREQNPDPERCDLIIIGAGPAGLAAAIAALEQGYRILVLESAQPFNTIVNFPARKPIYVTPEQPPMHSALRFTDGTKETLLEQLRETVTAFEIPLRQGEKVDRVTREDEGFSIHTASGGEYSCLRVIVAIGKTGNARMLDVPGEKRANVYSRLIDPAEHRDQDILVVGGGDSALEAAIALAEKGNRVTLSYRKKEFSRPKGHNVERFFQLADEGALTPVFESTVREIGDGNVVLDTPEGEKTIRNDVVYTLIGTEIPIRFFRRSGIRMEKEKNARWWVNLVAMVSFFTMLYFGKSGSAVEIFHEHQNAGARLFSYLTAPMQMQASWKLEGHQWYGPLNFLIGWLGSVVFVLSGALSLLLMLREPGRYFATAWGKIKYGYIIGVAVLFTGIYFSTTLSKSAGWIEEPTYWYSLLYTTTILLFGFRRIQQRPTGYIAAQTLAFTGIQVFFLFLLPFHLYDILIAPLGEQIILVQQVFPHGKWSSFGLVLFWPLNIANFGTSSFWTWFPFVQTFIILPLIVWRWGKGIYCGWICSCGAMAESLGDEYRTATPHGTRAKALENIGQVVLWFAFVATALHFAFIQVRQSGTLPADTLWGVYKIGIDVVFAGVLGLGVYFFLGGRIWCRYGCPLAALMHIFARFSPYRIMANKKRCISCNICTKVCHMGIDVMGYANRGIPMNDVQCVRCSACIVNCPMQVLTFGSVPALWDPDNVVHEKGYIPLARDWTSGLGEKELAERLEEERVNHPELHRRPVTGMEG
jgi:thioredoxin reductase/ferredoxin